MQRCSKAFHHRCGEGDGDDEMMRLLDDWMIG